MATKKFCDLCGGPAMDPSFAHHTFRKDTLNRIGYHLCVQFTEASTGHPRTTDEKKDCCASCMAVGLETIASNLRQSVQKDSK